jgi:hypothetical protein
VTLQGISLMHKKLNSDGRFWDLTAVTMKFTAVDQGYFVLACDAVHFLYMHIKIS